MADSSLFVPDASILPAADIPNVSLDPAAMTPGAGASSALLPAGATLTPNAVPDVTLSDDTTASATGLPRGCKPTSLPMLESIGNMTGQVCQFTYPANLLSIQKCCSKEVTPQIQGNCTQFCEVTGSKGQFQHCVKDLVGTLPKQQRPKKWKVKCQEAEGPAKGKAAQPSPTGTAGTNAAVSAYKGVSVMGFMVVALAFGGLAAL